MAARGGDAGIRGYVGGFLKEAPKPPRSFPGVFRQEACGKYVPLHASGVPAEGRTGRKGWGNSLLSGIFAGLLL